MTERKSISFKTAFLIVIVLHLGAGAFFMIPPPKNASKSTVKKEQYNSSNISSEKNEKQHFDKITSHQPIASNQLETAKVLHNPSANVLLESEETKTIPQVESNKKKVTAVNQEELSSHQQENLKKLWKQIKNQARELTITTTRPVEPLHKPSSKIVHYNSFEEIPSKEEVSVKENFIEQRQKQIKVNHNASYVNKETPAPVYQTVKVIQHFNDDPHIKQRYTLKSGDTLYGISRKFNVSFQDLVEYNQIRDVRDLYAGQTLNIP